MSETNTEQHVFIPKPGATDFLAKYGYFRPSVDVLACRECNTFYNSDKHYHKPHTFRRSIDSYTLGILKMCMSPMFKNPCDICGIVEEEHEYHPIGYTHCGDVLYPTNRPPTLDGPSEVIIALGTEQEVANDHCEDSFTYLYIAIRNEGCYTIREEKGSKAGFIKDYKFSIPYYSEDHFEVGDVFTPVFSAYSNLSGITERRVVIKVEGNQVHTIGIEIASGLNSSGHLHGVRINDVFTFPAARELVGKRL